MHNGSGTAKLKIAALTFLVIGAAIFILTLIKGLLYVPEREMSLKFAEAGVFDQKDQNNFPERIIIPKIDLDAHIEQVGLTFKGNMGTPKNFLSTGWYKYGTIPGSLGSAVIDGHVSDGFNLPGVFSDLHELQVGDDIYVRTNSDRMLHFVVVDVKSYPYKEVPREELFNKADAPRLNLVTCEGDWLGEEETAEKRLIVYSRLVGSI